MVKLRNSLAAPTPAADDVTARRDHRVQHDANVIRQRVSILRRRPPRLNAHHRLPQFRCAADVAAFVKRDATSSRSSGIGYPRASCLGPKPCTGCLWLVGPDVKPGHGLTRVLSFPSPSGRRDQMTAFIGRREFITLLGGAAQRGRSRRGRSRRQRRHAWVCCCTALRRLNCKWNEFAVACAS